jgi:hypothetical protein
MEENTMLYFHNNQYEGGAFRGLGRWPTKVIEQVY